MARLACLVAICALAACGSASRPFDDGGNGPPDANTGPPDAEIPDAMPQVAPGEAKDIVGAAGRMSSTTYTLDVELGHGVSQKPVSSTTYTFEGNAAIKP